MDQFLLSNHQLLLTQHIYVCSYIGCWSLTCCSFLAKVRLRGMLSGSRSWRRRRRVLRSTLSLKVSNGNLPSNTKMILGPGFIPPTQLLLFSFSQSSYFAFSPMAGENYREGNSIIYLGKRLCHHFHQHLNECTSVK